MGRTDSLKTLILGKIECGRRKGRQRMRWLDDITDGMNMSLSKLRELMDRKAWCAADHAADHGVAKSGTQLSNWTELNWYILYVHTHTYIYGVLYILYIYSIFVLFYVGYSYVHKWDTIVLYLFLCYLFLVLISNLCCLLLLSRFSRVQLCATPETAAHQAPPSMGFSRQEHWSGLPFPSPMHEREKWRWSCSVVSNS